MTTNKGANRTFFVTIIFYVGISFLWSGLTRNIETSIYVDILISQSMIFLPAFIYLKKSGTKIKDFIPYRKIRLSDALLAVLLTYLFYPVIVVVNLLTMFFVENQAAEMAGAMQSEYFVLNILCFALLPACVEEFVFRGMLYQTYKKSCMRIAVFLSAFLFGCMHLNFNQFLYTFVFGIFLVMVMEATGSIFASMICHFILNMNTVILTKIQGGLDTGNLTEESNALLNNPNTLLIGTLCWVIIAVITTSGAFGIWVYLAKKNQRLEEIRIRFKEPKTEKFITASLIMGIIFAIILMILIELVS